jgi:hypothetical protein
MASRNIADQWSVFLLLMHSAHVRVIEATGGCEQRGGVCKPQNHNAHTANRKVIDGPLDLRHCFRASSRQTEHSLTLTCQTEPGMELACAAHTHKLKLSKLRQLLLATPGY